MNEKLEILKSSEEKLKEQFKLLASEILELNSKKLTEQNKQSLETVLSPVKVQLSEFKKKVEDVYDKEAKDRSILQHELKVLKELMGDNLNEHTCDVAYILREDQTFRLLSVDDKKELLSTI